LVFGQHIFKYSKQLLSALLTNNHQNYFFIKTFQWHISLAIPTRFTNFSDLFYFVVALYMFRTVFSSIIRSLKLCIQHRVCTSSRFCWLLASENEIKLQFHLVPASKQSAEFVWHIPDAVCTVLDSWWWKKRRSETCRVLLQNKINLRNWCISLGFDVGRSLHHHTIQIN
jgi:hypothetical protein